MGFTRDELESYANTTIPDLLGPDVRLLFVGINPGLWTAATQSHFSSPSNRFYPALFAAGIIERPIARGAAHTDDDRQHFLERGLGISNVAHRTTAKASELSKEELRQGGLDLRALVRSAQPAVVALAGITAYRTAFGQPKAKMGEQATDFEGARLWVVPNPSGLNAHETVDSLAAAYAEPARAAGII